MSYSHSKLRRLRVNNLKSRLTSLESKHSLRPRATHSGTRRRRQQASLGLSRRAGANAHQTQKPRAGCPARARQPTRPQPPAAPAGRLDSGNRPPAGLPAGSCPSPNKQPKKTLAAKTWRRPRAATRTPSKLQENSEGPWRSPATTSPSRPIRSRETKHEGQGRRMGHYHLKSRRPSRKPANKERDE